MKKITQEPDSQALQDVTRALMAAQGRGGLTWLASRLGMTASALRRRLYSPTGAFDAPTMRAVLLVTASKAQPGDPTPQKAGNYQVGIVDRKPKWRAKQ